MVIRKFKPVKNAHIIYLFKLLRRKKHFLMLVRKAEKIYIDFELDI